MLTKWVNDTEAATLGMQVNLRERQGFIIHPFTVPISTSAAQLTLEKDGYVIEPAFDFKQRAGYLSVAKDHNKYNLRGSYAFREVSLFACSENLFDQTLTPPVSSLVTVSCLHVRFCCK